MKSKRTYNAEKSREELLELYHRVLGGEQILRQQITEDIVKDNHLTKKVKNVYYSIEEAAQGIRKMQGLDIEKQQIEVKSDVADRLISARKRTKSDQNQQKNC